jgi:hypothetical protein
MASSYQNADAIVRLLVRWLLSALVFPIGVLVAFLLLS